METTTQPNSAELNKIHTQEEETLAEWAGEDLSAEDRAVLAELNDEARERRRSDGTELFRAKQLAANIVQAAREQDAAQADNDWTRNPDAN